MQYMQCYLPDAQVWKLHNIMYLNINNMKVLYIRLSLKDVIIKKLCYDVARSDERKGDDYPDS